MTTLDVYFTYTKTGQKVELKGVHSITVDSPFNCPDLVIDWVIHIPMLKISNLLILPHRVHSPGKE